ncbi:hypothetical protein E8E12_003382 [Didymella heteroderae]|uniref:Uncharacterized protein n=1 Tax=Didymella heteroderae TaxID=1769908 RepID=A0A9P5BXF3_9PLEO|nr:hypothetical protein E8E12_003382 [Didymella heteroderae]
MSAVDSMTTTARQMARQERKDLEVKITQTVGRMMQKPLVIMLDNKKLCEIDAGTLKRLQNGDKYTASDWSKILDLLVVSKATDANVFVKESGALSAVRFCETIFWIRSVGEPRRETTWCITVCRPTDNTISTYSIGQVTGERQDLSDVANVFGVEKHLLRYMYEQETCSNSICHRLFQDAVLLDMLLDLIADDFAPHQRHIEDGLTLQLEILEALEKAQNDAAVANAAARASASTFFRTAVVPTLDKKRISMTDRLKSKKSKVEL